MVMPVDVKNEPGDLDNLVKDLGEAAAARAAGANHQVDDKPKAEKPSWCPDKFWDAEKGEVQADKLAQSYTSLQSAHGRMANDLGRQRKLTDQLVRPDNTPGSQPQKRELPRVTSAELLEKPNETLERVIAADRAAAAEEADRKAALQEAELQQETFAYNHPDAAEITADPAFGAWVMESPLRIRAAQQARVGDYGVADALLADYKENGRLKPVAKPQNDPIDAARRSSLERPAGGSGTGAEGQKKIWRRVDIVELKLRKPHIYRDPAVQAEIMEAYRDNRVK